MNIKQEQEMDVKYFEDKYNRCKTLKVLKQLTLLKRSYAIFCKNREQE